MTSELVYKLYTAACLVLRIEHYNFRFVFTTTNLKFVAILEMDWTEDKASTPQ